MIPCALSVLAPALYGTLVRRWPDQICLFEAAFNQGEKWGSTLEHEYQRVQGASFNPRPARLAQIVLKNRSACVGPDLISACFLFAAPFENYHSLDSALQTPLKLAEQTYQALHSKIFKETLGADHESLALSAQIDYLRHTHMLKEVDKAQTIYESLHWSGMSFTENDKLKIVRDHILAINLNRRLK